MRIWSIHPKYLDTRGLIAVWREALLAKNVLDNKTKGYKNHPQLDRFKATEKPAEAINQYLSEIYMEAKSRNFNFDQNKIDREFKPSKITVTNEQIKYEFNHLLKKLQVRNTSKYNQIKNTKKIETLNIFQVIEGKIEKWEVVSDKIFDRFLIIPVTSEAPVRVNKQTRHPFWREICFFFANFMTKQTICKRLKETHRR